MPPPIGGAKRSPEFARHPPKVILGGVILNENPAYGGHRGGMVVMAVAGPL
jgi:hypothetical protein